MNALFLLLCWCGPCGQSGDGPAGRFFVHEWGTFTSFAGSDGVCLEYRPLAHDDLPAFVHDRARQAGLAGGNDAKSALAARQRMETPVTYSYTDRPRVVDVTARFPRGLFTEFYPPVTRMEPAYDPEVFEPPENMELVTSETERRLQETAAKLANGSAEEREAALAALARFGRFAEPALRRALDRSSDADLRRRAAELLENVNSAH